MNENNTQQLTEQIARLQAELAAIKQNTTPPPPKPKKDYFALKLVAYVLSFFLLVFLGFYLWACFWPLPDDDEVYNAGKEAHDALYDLNTWRSFHGGDQYDCSNSCPICHPSTWRYAVRKIRGQAP